MSRLGSPQELKSTPVLPSPALLKERSGDSALGCQEIEDEATAPLTLALNSTPTDEIPQTRRQLGSFCLDARRKLLRAGGALERYDPQPLHCVFLTGTLPGSVPSAYRGMADESARIVHRLKKWVAKRYNVHQFSFYCWELQKRGALHLHYLVYVPDSAARKRILDEFRQFWIDLLKSLSDETGVDFFKRSQGGTHRHDTRHVQAYAQECYSSVAAYMAKYVGKEAGKYSLEYAPKRWSGVSRPLGRLIEQFTDTMVIDTPTYTQASSIYNAVSEELTVSPAVCHKYRHRAGIGDTTLAYYNGNFEEQQCQLLNASETMNLKNYARTSLPNSKTVETVYTLKSMASLLLPQCFPGYPVSCHPVVKDWGTTAEEALSQFLMESRQRTSIYSMRDLRTTLSVLLSSTPTRTLLSLSLQRWEESLRLLVRSLWHLSEGTDSQKELSQLQRVVKELLTEESEIGHSCTSQSHLNGGAGEGYQIPLL